VTTTLAIAAALVAVSVGDAARHGPEHTVLTAGRAAARVRNFFSTGMHSLDRIEQGREGYFRPTIRYSPRLIPLFQSAHHHGCDILADFETLQRAWRQTNGDAPLAMRFVSPSTFEPITGRWAYATNSPPEPVGEAHFDEQQALLREIYILVTEGDGSGRGILRHSGYLVEPNEPDSAPASPSHP